MKKSRCEVSPDGHSCLSCYENHKACYVTDRVLNVTSIRGEAFNLKCKVDDLKQQYQEFDAKIKDYAKQISDRDNIIESLMKQNANYRQDLLQWNRKLGAYPETRPEDFTEASPCFSRNRTRLDIVPYPSTHDDHDLWSNFL